jgi:hypothetical protein
MTNLKLQVPELICILEHFPLSIGEETHTISKSGSASITRQRSKN